MPLIKEKIVILSGGLATRLYPYTRKIPKSLIDISGKPFIIRQLELLKQKGFSNIVVCAGFLGQMIKNCISEADLQGINVEFSFDGENLLGTGGAIKKALSVLTDNFFVLYGDSYLDIDYKSVIDYFYKTNSVALMTVYENKNLWDKSNVVFEDNFIKNYDKKMESRKMSFIDYGLGIFNNRAYSDYSAGKIIFDLEEIYKNFIEVNRLTGYEVFQRFYEIGSPEGLQETRNFFQSQN